MVKDAFTNGDTKKPVRHPQPVFLFNYTTCLFVAGLRSPPAEVRLPTSFALAIKLSQVSAGEWVVLRYHPKRSDLYVYNCRLMVRGFGLPTLTHSPCVPDRLPARGLLHHLSGTHNTTSPCGFSEALPRSAPRGFAAPLDIISITHCQPKVKCFQEKIIRQIAQIFAFKIVQTYQYSKFAPTANVVGALKIFAYINRQSADYL